VLALTNDGFTTLAVDGKQAGTIVYTQTIDYRMSPDEMLNIGEYTETPVSEDYQMPFPFTG
jgi:hypothetical protein